MLFMMEDGLLSRVGEIVESLEKREVKRIKYKIKFGLYDKE